MKSWMFALFLHATSFAWGAEILSFPEVWKTLSQQSKAQKAASLQAEAATVAEDRAQLHWLPRVYLQAKTFQTNDPSTSFVGLLEQRSLTGSDFNPDTINHPDSQFYTQAALGLDWPLYEGGMKAAQVQVQSHLHLSAEKEASSVQVEQYSEVAKAYGSISVLQQEKLKLEQILQMIGRLLKTYQLGVRSNPLGYSGLLGMKSLSNRLQGLIQANESQSQSYFSALSEMGLEKTQWMPTSEDPSRFVDVYLKPQSDESSAKLESLREKSLVAAESAQMEKARYLPRIGAFAETGVFKGPRDTAQNNTAGLYLQWNLWSPADSGAFKEARLKSLASENAAAAYEQKEKGERGAANQSVQILKENLRLLNDSDQLLMEQTRVTENLFKNGSINALQFVEVLSRRTDLIVNHTETSLQLIETSAEAILKSRFDDPIRLEQGRR